MKCIFFKVFWFWLSVLCFHSQNFIRRLSSFAMDPDIITATFMMATQPGQSGRNWRPSEWECTRILVDCLEACTLIKINCWVISTIQANMKFIQLITIVRFRAVWAFLMGCIQPGKGQNYLMLTDHIIYHHMQRTRQTLMNRTVHFQTVIQ